MPPPKKHAFPNEANKKRCLKQREYRLRKKVEKEEARAELSFWKERAKDLQKELKQTRLALRIVRNMPEMVFGDYLTDSEESADEKDDNNTKDEDPAIASSIPEEAKKTDASIPEDEKKTDASIAVAKESKKEDLAGKDEKKTSYAGMLTRQQVASREKLAKDSGSKGMSP